MNKENKSRLMLIISMAIFGTLAPFVRNVAVSSGELALYRAIMAAILIGMFLLITKQRIPFKKIKKEIPLLLFSGMAMGINWILLFEAYKYTTVSAATLSYYFAPVIVTLVCPFLFREKLTPKQIICFAMSTIGLILVIGINPSAAGNTSIKGILFGLGAACFYATVILLNKFIKTVEGIHRTFLQFLSAIIILIPYVLFTDGINLGSLNTSGWVNLLILGLVHTGITYCLYFSSLKELPGQKAAILSYIDPLVAVIVSVVILRESISLGQIAGGALILGFTLFNELPSPKTIFGKKNMSQINKRPIAMCILLSIVTLGIYLIYWEYLLVKNTKAIKNDTSSCTSEMLCLIFVPFYFIYWCFTRGKLVKDQFASLGYTATGNETAYLILGIFGLGIISMAIMQNDFNSLPSEITATSTCPNQQGVN